MRGWSAAVLFCGLLYYYNVTLISLCSCEKRSQFILEHATVTYYNPRYLENLTLISRRYSRKDPKRYMSMFAISKKPFDNTLSLYLDFYELLSNVYKPSFVSLHFLNYCDLVNNDTLVGPAITAAYLRSTPVEKRMKHIGCPFPPGEYAFENFTIPYPPVFKHFPFANGRIYGNLSVASTKETVTSFYVDMTIK